VVQQFRPEYALLRNIRTLIERVPWFAYSATLDPESLEMVKRPLGGECHVEGWLSTYIFSFDMLLAPGVSVTDLTSSFHSRYYLLSTWAACLNILSVPKKTAHSAILAFDPSPSLATSHVRDLSFLQSQKHNIANLDTSQVEWKPTFLILLRTILPKRGVRLLLLL
jgi:hypothetical protein